MKVWVKDVFKNQGRYTLTLDPGIDKSKVTAMRKQRRKKAQRLSRLKRLGRPALERGQVVEATIARLADAGLYVDVGAPKLSLLQLKDLRAALDSDALPEGEELDLRRIAKPGGKVKVQIEDVQGLAADVSFVSF